MKVNLIVHLINLVNLQTVRVVAIGAVKVNYKMLIRSHKLREDRLYIEELLYLLKIFSYLIKIRFLRILMI
jgi:hypothetical protein